MSNDIFDKTSPITSKGRNTLSLNEYLDLAKRNPSITHSATQRIYEMIMSYGTKKMPDGSLEYLFFQGRIFGSTKQIERIMSYFKGASLGLDIKKRVLLLLGPPGGGKSLFLSYIKKGLSDYTRTNEGALYKIQGCPINEEPLHLYEDEESRRKIWSEHGLKIEGKLCPHCKFKLEREWANNLNNAVIERCYLDEETRTGIGTFAPSEKNDMSELYGSTNQRKITEYGTEGDPRSYDFNGELHKANRGIMEFIEVLKADPSFLHILLTLAEEQQFKTPRFPLQYVDEALIAHTNEGEFIRFIQNRENEAIIDRLFIVHMPYNLEPKKEDLIYHSALRSKLTVEGISIHPGAIHLASCFVCMTRKSEFQKKRFDFVREKGGVITGNTQLEEVFSRDGMHGFSPRFILNAMAIALVDSTDPIVSVEGFYNTLKKLIEDYAILSDYDRVFYSKILEVLFEKNYKKFSNMTIEDVDLEELNRVSKNNLFG